MSLCMTTETTSAKINAIRSAAGNTLEKCCTCGRPAASPYRRHVEGKIVEGCIDAIHTTEVYGETLSWHMRPVAVAMRKATLQHLRSL